MSEGPSLPTLTYAPHVLALRTKSPSHQIRTQHRTRGLLRFLALLCFVTTIVGIHVHYVQPVPLARSLLCYLVEFFYVPMHFYGLGLTTRIQPHEAVIFQSAALWTLMCFHLLEGSETSLLRAFLLPPALSFTSMSALLLFVHGTLAIWFLPYTNWTAVHTDPWLWVQHRLDEPGYVLIRFGVGSSKEGLLRALALLGFVTPIPMIHRYYVQPVHLSDGAFWCFLAEFLYVLMHLYGLGWRRRAETEQAFIFQSIVLWALTGFGLATGNETSVVRAVLLPPIVSFVTMSSLLFFLYGTLGTWLLPHTKWEVYQVGHTLVCQCDKHPVS
ncbi:hypothetical protein PM082_000803 [Marasmius tenuissimus]|nr:hypothetical protein PM082_000803 [Marasmius tenuissimus]